MCPLRALESATRALLLSQPSASALSLHLHALRCGRPPVSGGWLGGCGHGAWGEPTPMATARARKPGMPPRTLLRGTRLLSIPSGLPSAPAASSLARPHR